MKAFHNDPKIKTKYLARVRAHAAADQIIKGIYWENGKGCAVGCTIHSNDHSSYETELGIPMWLAYVQDRIFEGLNNGNAKRWPVEFLEAIAPGQDLEKIKIPFLIFVLNFTLDKFDHKKHPKEKEAIVSVLNQFLKKTKMNEATLKKAQKASYAVAYAAASAAFASASAADADASAAASAAAYASAAAASAAANANANAASASASASAAFAAAYAAAFAAVSGVAASAARSSTYKLFADKIIELIKNNGGP